MFTMDYVKNKIREAFKGVELGDGIGLWQAQAIDDYKSKEEQLVARVRDVKNDWQLIPTADLFYCDSSLTFFDEKGMRFHLPAFIILELNDEENIGCFNHLTHHYNSYRELFNSLNSVQKMAIATFIEWCFIQPRYEFERPHILRALEEFWYKN